MSLRTVLLGLLLLPGAARASTSFDSVEVGLKGNTGQDAGERSFDWGPTLSVGILTSDKGDRDRFKYEMEYSYDDAYSKLSAAGTEQQSRVRTHELKYAKISLLGVRGYDLKERLRFVPFVSGGVQYVDSRGNADGERVEDFYWAPTWGAGVDITLSKKTTLGLAYDANTLGGSRRVASFSLELKIAVLGDDE
ncbi:MAG: outer membrane protein [Elusimicrobiota bacterium]